MCVQVFKCMNGEICENFNGYFDVLYNKTRNSGKLLRLPRVKLESTKKTFRFTGAKFYNELPIDVRSATSTKEFKILFDRVLT